MKLPPHSVQAEQAVLGALLTDDKAIADVADLISAEDFYRADHRAIYEAIQRCDEAGKAFDAVSLADTLERMNLLDEAGGLDHLVALAKGSVGSANVRSYAEIIRDKAVLRRLISAGAHIQHVAQHTEGRTASEVLDDAQSRVMQVERPTGKGPRHILADGKAWIEEMDQRSEQGGAIVGLSTGLTDLDNRTLGMEGGDLWILAARPSMGKAQPLSSKVLLASGEFIPMGDVRVGDSLASVDGAESVVTGVYPQGARDVYALEFSDGRMVECDGEHLWRVASCKFKQDRTLTALEIAALLEKERFQGRIRVVGHSGDFGRQVDLGVDPWLLGFLLGDGSLSSGCVRFSNPEEYILERVSSASGMTPKRVPGCGCDWVLSTERGKANTLLESLQKLGVMGARAEQKAIPGEVFTATRDTREQVLAGLLESDGWVERFGCVRFSSASQELAYGVVRLARSLGGKATLTVRESPKYSYQGETRTGQPAHIVSVAVPNISSFIRSPRLLEHLKERTVSCQPTIRAVHYIGRDVCQCISVSHPSKLYLTDGYIPTHNTSVAMSMMLAVAKAKKPVLFFSLEMPEKQLITRAVASLGRIDSEKVRKADLDPEEWQRVMVAMTQLKEMPLYIDTQGGITLTDIRARARRVKRRHGLGLIVVDYLQLMSGKGENRTQEVTEISKGLKNVAKEMNVPVVALSQLNRSVESRHNKRPIMADLRESGSIEQDADVIAFLYRETQYNDNCPFPMVAELDIAKQRNGPTGTVLLHFNGPQMRFSDLDHESKEEYRNWERSKSATTSPRGFNA